MSLSPAAGDEPMLRLWCRFLSSSTDDDLEDIAREDPIMTQAKVALEELSADPQARERAERRKMSEMAYWTSVNAARRDGRAEGEAIGRAEGEAIGRIAAKVESLQRVLSSKFGAPSDRVLDRLRHADEATLDRWFEAALRAIHLDDVLDDPSA